MRGWAMTLRWGEPTRPDPSVTRRRPPLLASPDLSATSVTEGISHSLLVGALRNWVSTSVARQGLIFLIVVGLLVRFWYGAVTGYPQQCADRTTKTGRIVGVHDNLGQETHRTAPRRGRIEHPSTRVWREFHEEELVQGLAHRCAICGLHLCNYLGKLCAKAQGVRAVERRPGGRSSKTLRSNCFLRTHNLLPSQCHRDSPLLVRIVRRQDSRCAAPWVPGPWRVKDCVGEGAA
jgi:hypothetical protein